MLNFSFYKGLFLLPQTNESIIDVLSWKKNYSKLEKKHYYIQWIFPTTQPSAFNNVSNPLNLPEIEAMKNDSAIMKRLNNAFIMMIDFWGWSYENGVLYRTEDYLNRYSWFGTHNNLRISRVLLHLTLFSEYPKVLALCKRLVFEVTCQLGYKSAHYELRTCKDFWLGNVLIGLEGREGEDVEKLRQYVNDMIEMCIESKKSGLLTKDEVNSRFRLMKL